MKEKLTDPKFPIIAGLAALLAIWNTSVIASAIGISPFVVIFFGLVNIGGFGLLAFELFAHKNKLFVLIGLALNSTYALYALIYNIVIMTRHYYPIYYSILVIIDCLFELSAFACLIIFFIMGAKANGFAKVLKKLWFIPGAIFGSAFLFTFIAKAVYGSFFYGLNWFFSYSLTTLFVLLLALYFTSSSKSGNSMDKTEKAADAPVQDAAPAKDDIPSPGAPARIFCASCGHELSPNSIFCPVCGTKRNDL